MPLYNVTEYSDNYSETCGSLWQYYRDEPFLNNNGAIADFPSDNNNSASFRFKTKIVARIGNNGTKDVKVMIPLKYFSNFWRTLEMSFINCEIGLILNESANWFVIDTPVANQIPTFTITVPKRFVPVVTLLIQNNKNQKQESRF